MRYAVINLATRLVENVAEIGDESHLEVEHRSKPEEGFSFVASDAAEIGDHWDGRDIIPARQQHSDPRPTLTPEELRKSAYITESDHLVIRAMRLQLAGDPGFEAAKREALAKVEAIQTRYPEGK